MTDICKRLSLTSLSSLLRWSAAETGQHFASHRAQAQAGTRTSTLVDVYREQQHEELYRDDACPADEYARVCIGLAGLTQPCHASRWLVQK